MAIDLVGLVSQFLTPQLVGSLARAVGINEAAAQKLVSAAIPVVLGALATTAAAPGGAQKLVDAVSNSDPDLLTKLSGAISGGNVGPLNQGANWLGGLLGGSGLSSIAGALGQFSGAPQGAAQSAIGAVAQSAIGAIGREDPSNWSDPASIAAMFGAQKNAILSSDDRDRWSAVLCGNGSAIYGRREAHAAPPQCCRVRGKERCMECRTRPVPGFRVLFPVGQQREIAADSRPPL